MKQDYLKKKNFIEYYRCRLHAYEKSFKRFWTKNYDLYLKSDILLLADVLKNFRKICLKIDHLDPVKVLSAPVLAWQAALKKTEVKLDLITDINMLLIVEKGIRERMCHAIHGYAKGNNKYMKYYDKNKESSCPKYWDVNNLYSWAISQKRKKWKV